MLKIWDLSTQKSVFTFDAHKNGVNSISFSENGYYVATSGNKDNVVKIWDLRGPKMLKEIELPNNVEIRNVKFDYSGNYLGIAGTNINLYHVKTWSLFAQFNEHSDIVTDFNFSKNCSYFGSTSMDRNLKIFNKVN